MNELEMAVKEYKRYRDLRNAAAARKDLRSLDVYNDELQVWVKILNQYDISNVKAALTEVTA